MAKREKNFRIFRRLIQYAHCTSNLFHLYGAVSLALNKLNSLRFHSTVSSIEEQEKVYVWLSQSTFARMFNVLGDFFLVCSVHVVSSLIKMINEKNAPKIRGVRQRKMHLDEETLLILNETAKIKFLKMKNARKRNEYNEMF